MPIMKKIAALTIFLVPLILCFQGCTKSPPQAKGTKAGAAAAHADTLKPALDLLRVATETSNYRDALHLFNAQLAKNTDKPVPPLGTPEIEALRVRFGLDKEELAELTAGVFRPIDAFHLQSCFLLRDASRQLEVPKAPPCCKRAGRLTGHCAAWPFMSRPMKACR